MQQLNVVSFEVSQVLLYLKWQQIFPDFATCTDEEECTVHTKCDEFLKLTEKGRLTNDERKYFLSRMCKVVNREYHVCCARTKNDEMTTELIPLTSRLPEAPKCGFYLGDKVSFFVQF